MAAITQVMAGSSSPTLHRMSMCSPAYQCSPGRYQNFEFGMEIYPKDRLVIKKNQKESLVFEESNYKKDSHCWLVSHNPPSDAHSPDLLPGPCRFCWQLSQPRKGRKKHLKRYI